MEVIHKNGEYIQQLAKKKTKTNEELYLLRYNGALSVESQPTLQRNLSPLSSGSKNKPSKQQP
jgi:hypothetical protein